MTKEKLPLSLLAFALLAVWTTTAGAQVNSTGGVVMEVSRNLDPINVLITGLSYLFGFGLVGSGLLRLKETADRGDRSFGDGLMRLTGGTLLVCVPTVLGVGLSTLFDASGNYSIVGETAAAPQLCIGGASSEGPLLCMVNNLNRNLVPVFVDVSFGLMVLVGVVMVVHAIYTMAMAQSQGSRGMSKGWAARLVIGFVIANLPTMLHAIEGTFGITGGVIAPDGFDRSSSLLSYSGPAVSLGPLASYTKLVEALLTLFVMFGIIAVWRGIFLLRAFADGNGQGTMGSGLTHVVGGVLLANAKFTICVVVNTFVGAGEALGFC